MNRRRRFDVFFILYLTAILGFIVISHQRTKTNSEIEKKAYDIARTFLPPLRMEFDSDTLFWYADADDRTGDIPVGSGRFAAHLFVHDISVGDSVEVTAISYSRNDTLRYDSTVQVSAAQSAGDPEGRIVIVPLTFGIRRTGVYRFAFRGKARRVHPADNGTLRYHDIVFSRGLLPGSLVEGLETSLDTLTAIVRDSSSSASTAVDALTLRAEKPAISTAIGFDIANTIVSNLGWKSPVFRIVRGGGVLERGPKGMREATCRWRGSARFYTDTVVVEASIDRGAGGRDIARTSFVVNAAVPTLEESHPAVLYAGEDATISVKVRGLENAESYRWSYDNIGGSGPRIVMRIPSDYGGRTIRLMSTYDGTPYPYRDASRHTAGLSTFSFPVVNPPMHIAFVPPDHPSWRTVFTFTAARYSDARYILAAPVRDVSQVHVHAARRDGSPVHFELSMVRNGLFALRIEGADNYKGETITIAITIGDTTVSRQITFKNE